MRIAIYSPNIDGGGLWSFTITLASALVDRGYEVDLVAGRVDASQLPLKPREFDIYPLTKSSSGWGVVSALRAYPRDTLWLARASLERAGANRQIRAVAGLARYLRHRKPDMLIANLWQCGVAAVRARALANTATRIVTVAHLDSLDSLGPNATPGGSKHSVTARMIGRIHERAEARVAVSAALARSFEKAVDLPANSVQTIYNPVVDSALLESARCPVEHPWFNDADIPVVVAVGRLVPQKGFDILIDALARVRQRRVVRLAILGDGPERCRLQARASQLGVADDIAFVGWVDQPAAFMARSAMLVSASRFEGLQHVLIEALACGCPVVATDCPSGPAEVLDHGRYGRLVQVDDAVGLSTAIEATLDSPPVKTLLKKRASDFSVEKSVDQYERLISKLCLPQDCTSPSNDVAPKTL